MQSMVLEIPHYNINSIYSFDGYPVPRVNDVLSSMIHEDYIVEWANSIGKRGMDYHETLSASADKGTYTHEKIDKFLKKEDYNIPIPAQYSRAVNNAFSGFMTWWNDLNRTNYVKVLMNECRLTSPIVGGTLDLFIQINRKKYLLDFKTSNHPSYRYHLQLSAYEHLLEYNYGIQPDGWIILMLDKYRQNKYNELVVERPSDEPYMNRCKETFIMFADCYYHKLGVMDYYDKSFNK